MINDNKQTKNRTRVGVCPDDIYQQQQQQQHNLL